MLLSKSSLTIKEKYLSNHRKIITKNLNHESQEYGLEKTYRATKTSLFDRNWAISLTPRQRSRPLRLVW
jgi:hypothetical protein